MREHDHQLDHPARLAALRRVALLDTPTEAAFDRLTRLACRILHVPVALVTLVAEDRQFFKSCVGLPEPWASRRETPLTHSFCQYPVVSQAPLVVEDARRHPVLRDNLAIVDLGVIAYLGIPLISSEGHALGSFCVIDSQPRAWTADEVAIVADLAASVIVEIELRASDAELRRAQEDLEHWVRERTIELARAGAALQSELAELVLATHLSPPEDAPPTSFHGGELRRHAPASASLAADTDADLSAREADVVRLSAAGYSNKEIAAMLDVSVKTIETYKARAMGKLGLNSRVALVRYAAQQGWLPPA
jgi:DNA-binding CsgD family transcriptional regulator